MFRSHVFCHSTVQNSFQLSGCHASRCKEVFLSLCITLSLVCELCFSLSLEQTAFFFHHSRFRGSLTTSSLSWFLLHFQLFYYSYNYLVSQIFFCIPTRTRLIDLICAVLSRTLRLCLLIPLGLKIFLCSGCCASIEKNLHL